MTEIGAGIKEHNFLFGKCLAKCLSLDKIHYIAALVCCVVSRVK